MAASANPAEKFALVFGGHVETLMTERMEQNDEIFARYMSDGNFRHVINEWLSKEVYNRLQYPLQTGNAEAAGYDAQ